MYTLLLCSAKFEPVTTFGAHNNGVGNKGNDCKSKNKKINTINGAQEAGVTE